MTLKVTPRSCECSTAAPGFIAAVGAGLPPEMFLDKAYLPLTPRETAAMMRWLVKSGYIARDPDDAARCWVTDAARRGGNALRIDGHFAVEAARHPVLGRLAKPPMGTATDVFDGQWSTC